MHHLQQQLQLAQQEHRNLQARLEASKQAAAAREAEAAAAAAAEQAAKRAAAELKKQKQAAAAAAAVAGAQPHRSCPGVQLPQQSPQQFLQQQPVQLMQQAPVHAVQQYAGQQMHHQQPVQHLQPLTRQAEARLEMQGQQMLSRAANAQRSQSPVHSAVPTAAPNAFAGLSSSGMSFSPGCYSMQSPDYAACVLDMQQHVHTLKGSLARHRHHHRGHSPSHGRRDAKASDRLHTDDHNQEFSPARHNRSHAERVDRLHMVDHDAEVSPARHRRCRAERADRVHTDSRDKEAPPVRHSHAKRHDMRHTDRRGEEVSSVRDKHSHAALQELFDSDGRSEAESELEASSTGRDSSDSSSDRCIMTKLVLRHRASACVCLSLCA